jgi:hypothetical protein
MQLPTTSKSGTESPERHVNQDASATLPGHANALYGGRVAGLRILLARLGPVQQVLPGGLGNKFVRPITFSIVVPMQFGFVITRDESLVRVFGPLPDGFTS